MIFLTTLSLFLLALPSSAAPAPAPAPHNLATDMTKIGSFMIPRYRNENATARNGARALRRAYRKFSWPYPYEQIGEQLLGSFLDNIFGTDPSSTTNTPPDAAATSSSSSNGKVDAKAEQYDSEYLCPVEIGGQTLNLDFDTGSSDLWTFSTLLSSKQSGSHTMYDPKKSSSYKEMKGFSWQILYGDGSGASGVVGTDTVTIGGISVKNQAVELANQVSDEFVQDMANDGLVGLGFQSINDVQPTSQKTWFQNAIPQLKSPLFSVNLESDGSGFYQFGSIDTTQSHDNLAHIPVNSKSGFWQFESPTYGVGDQTFTNENASVAIADTGTSLLIVDPVVASAYWKQVSDATDSSSAGGYTFPCSSASSLPSVTLALGTAGYNVTIPGSLMNYAPIDSTESCFGALQSNAGSGMQIFGDVFFRAAYVVFEDSNSFTGLGVAAKNVSSN